jgi:hypothetical protein
MDGDQTCPKCKLRQKVGKLCIKCANEELKRIIPKFNLNQDLSRDFIK